jgi:lipid II:glycine glycyltransferase (peptidoglycan interpeptide bridge formation enzyme)
MIQLTVSEFSFRHKRCWFAPAPFDISGCDLVTFQAALTPDPGFDCKRIPTFLLDLTQSEETLLANLEQSTRYKLRQAWKKNLRLEIQKDHADFSAMYRDFVCAKEFAGDLRHLETFLNHGRLYTVYRDETLLAGLLTIEDDSQARWLLSGSRRLTDLREQSKVIGFANHMLVFEAARDARARGIHTFDLGGYYDGGDESDPRVQITRFKRGFGGAPVDRYTCTKIYSPLYRTAKRLKRRLSGSAAS